MGHLAGYDKSELLRLHTTDLALGNQTQIHLYVLQQTLQTGTFSTEMAIKRMDGSAPVEINSVRLPTGNVFILSRDVSARRKSEGALCESKLFLRGVLNSVATQIAGH